MLIQTHKHPTKAGDARLRYIDPKVLIAPFRDGDDIWLPEPVDNNGGMWFLEDKGATQFLYTRKVLSDRRDYSGLWFGGTDESPFFARIHGDADSAFRSIDEHLKPEIISRFERTHGRTANRQGDWLYLELDDGLTTKMATSLLFDGDPAKIVSHTRTSLGGTRHILEGEFVEFPIGRQQIYLGCGTLTAPDHTDRKILKPSVIAWARNLWAPQDSAAEYAEYLRQID